MKKYLLLVIVLVVAVSGVVACNPFANGTAENRELIPVSQGNLTITISGSGQVIASREANLRFDVSGKVDKVNVEENNRITGGTVLAELETDTFELQLTQSKAAIVQAQAGIVQAQAARYEAEYNLTQLKDVLHASADRIKVAEAGLAAAEAGITAAEAQLEAAQKAADQAQKQLDKTVITAPFDGVVANVNIDEGDLVAPSASVRPAIYMFDPNSLELEVDVDEIDLPSVAVGQEATISVDALPQSALEGQVKSISSVATEESGIKFYRVKIGLANPGNSQLKIGMSATADILITRRENVLLLPSRAIERGKEGNHYVNILVNGEVVPKPVVTGLSDGFDTEIVEGLEKGDTVVIVR